MRTMKRVAAVALSVVVLMTSGVSAKAAVTDVQPAKLSLIHISEPTRP